MPRRCVFCGGPANSREHAFPTWLSDVLPGKGDLIHASTREGSSPWRTDGFDFKVKQVCKRCNNEWLSDMETRTRPILEPLVLGNRTIDISVPEQKKLATWGYKTAIVLALITPPEGRFVPPEHYREFRETETPPNGTYIWVGAVLPELGGELRAGWSQPERLDYYSADGRPTDRHGYRLSFSVVSLTYQIVWDPWGAKLARTGESRDIFTRIGPISKGTWPPRRMLTLAALDDLSSGRFLSP